MKSRHLLSAFLSLLGIFLLGSTGYAQQLDTLLKQRVELYKHYQVLKNEKNSFWGSQSKQDLRNIISHLKNIINKDDEIIRLILKEKELERIQLKTESALKSNSLILRDKNLSEQVYELKNEVKSLKNQNHLRVQEKQKLKYKLSALKKENLILEIIIGILIVALIILYLISRMKIKAIKN
ncbi:MAG TPA: hypothetical protein VIK89_05825 [Cytophagaceae bacterium]